MTSQKKFLKKLKNKKVDILGEPCRYAIGHLSKQQMTMSVFLDIAGFWYLAPCANIYLILYILGQGVYPLVSCHKDGLVC